MKDDGTVIIENGGKCEQRKKNEAFNWTFDNQKDPKKEGFNAQLA